MRSKRRLGWMFWVLSPFFVLFVLVVTLYGLIVRNPVVLGVIVVLDALCILGFLAFYNPIRFRWAVRGAGLIIFMAYVGYLVYMLVESGGIFTWSFRRSDSTVLNAVVGLLVFGLPGLIIAFTGRLPSFLNRGECDEDEEQWE